MLRYISEKIINRLIWTNVIKYDDFEIYQFGLGHMQGVIIHPHH